ncbi:uncharacterized protein LOC111519169 [Drosophila willistoni]|uniref:uncharacterized protein LOC111519169 n=1 Tax=Drosophila willistoni TaxID=7260 RepID=UPI000C26D889|nr:uncharacterized protein LOC111519169 [Drosophila willistoni]
MSKCQCLERNLQMNRIHHEPEQMRRSHGCDSNYCSKQPPPCKMMQHQLKGTSCQHGVPVTAPKCMMHHNQSMLQHQNNELKYKQAHLKHQLNALQQRTSALQLEIPHMEQHIQILTDQCTEKGQIYKNIKATLLTAADEVMKAQTAESLPFEFLSKIFTIFDNDSKLMETFKQLDNDLSEIISKFCTEAYESRKEPLSKVIDCKLAKLRKDLIKKYDGKLKEFVKKQELNGLALKCKCFDILCDFLKGKDCISEDYLKEMKSIYEEESAKL